MRVDSSGRLLVGTTTPGDAAADNLTLSSSGDTGITIRASETDSSSIYFADGTGGTNVYTGAIIYDHATNHMSIHTNSGTEQLRIDSSGRLGVGTTSPSGKLDIVTGANGGNVLIDAESGSGYHAKIVNDAGDLVVGSRNTSADSFITSQRSIGFRSGSSETERLRIDSSGRMLVGTSSAVQSLIANQVQVETASDYTSLKLASNSTTADVSPFVVFARSRGTTNGATTLVANGDSLGGLLFAGADGTDLNTSAASIRAFVDGTPGSNDMPGRLVFSTTADGAAAPTERMRITSAGKIAMGNSVTAQPETLQVYALDAVNGYCILANVSGTGGRTHIRFENGNGIVGAINTSGTTTTYATSSDYRLKENVVPLTDSITRLQQLKPIRFNFIADADTTVDGFLAHEAQAVVPEAATGIKDEVDDNGDPVMQGIDQSKLVPLLTAALQEAIAAIETLEAKVAALEAA